MTTKESNSSSVAEKDEDSIGEEIVLKRYKLVRPLRLQERLEVNEATCAICDFNREILYYGYYDDKNECFNVCELCGKDLIARSKTALENSSSVAVAQKGSK